MNVATLLVQHLSARYAVLGPVVYRVRRITSEELRQAGGEDLVGLGSAGEALQAAQQELADQRVGDPVKAAEYRASDERREQERRRLRLEEELATPEGTARLRRRLQAYVVAAIDMAAPAQDRPAENPLLGRWDVVPSDARISDYAAGEFAPFRFVLDRDAHDPAEGRVWIGLLDDRQLLALGTYAITVQDVAGEVLPFRP